MNISPRVRPIARAALALIYLSAGILHLRFASAFQSIMPAFVPWPSQVVAVTGIAEICGAVGLYVPGLRRAAGLGLAFYAVCVFPANIQHAINDLSLQHPVLGWAYHGPRLLFQPVFVWWALWVADVIDWPLRPREVETPLAQR